MNEIGLLKSRKFKFIIIERLRHASMKLRSSWDKIIVFCIIIILLMINLISNYGFSLGSNSYDSNRLILYDLGKIFSRTMLRELLGL
jgi:hypothetical protein